MSRLFQRIAYLFRRTRFEAELNEEMRLHRDLRAEKLRKAGVPGAAAAARKLFGNDLLLREQSGDLWGWRAVEFLAHDLRFAVRQFRKNLVFTTVAVATLALGIGANTAIFSLVDQILLHPSGIADPQRLVAVRERYDKLGLKNIVVSPPTFADARDSRQIFEHTAASRRIDLNYIAQDSPQRLEGAAVSVEWFDVFGAKPLLGRVFVPEEDQPNANHVVVLSHAAWVRLFGADPNVLGRTIELSQERYQIVGVIGPTFQWPRSAEVWVPLALTRAALSPRNRFNEDLVAIARMKPGVSFAQADAWFKALTDRVWNAGTPGSVIAKNGGWGMFGVPFVDYNSGNTKRPVLVLLAAVGVLLLIACSNIAGLMLAKTSARTFEMGVRAALGAGRGRLWQQILAECVLLSLGGAVAGVGLAYAGLNLLLRIAPRNAVGSIDARIDPYVLAFTAVAAIGSGILFSLAPAWQISRVDAYSTLKSTARSVTAGPNRLRLRSALVMAESGLALLLLVTAGLFLRSFARIENVNPGFEPHGVMTTMFSLPPKQYADAGKQVVFYRTLLDRLENTNGVSAAAIALGVPFTDFGDSGSFLIEGRPLAPGDPGPHSERRTVSHNYFKALKIPIRAGRGFTAADNSDSESVALIDETLARQYWPNEDPLGQRIQPTSGPDWYTVVGIVGHVISSNLAADSGKGAIYFNSFQIKKPIPIGYLVAKSSGSGAGLASAIRAAVHEADPNQPLQQLVSLEDRIGNSLAPRTFVLWLLGLFAAIALFMAVLGLYGVISYSVAQRTRDIGIRIALGASRRSVLWSVITQGLRLTGFGVALGLAGSFLAQGVLQSLLFEVSAVDPLIFAGMAASLIAVSLVASYLPARRAVRIDPLVALRYE